MKTPGSMPSYVFNFYELLYDVFETVSGVNKATQGKEASSVTSGVQAQIYKSAATTKIDFKSRSLDQAIATLGQMWIAMISNLSLRPQNVSVVMPHQIEERRSYIGMEYQNMKFNVRAKAGSMLPENKMYVENKIMQLAQMGLITDPEFIIENVDLPGKEKLLQRMRDERAALQEQEELKQQPLTEEDLAGLGDNEDEIYRRMQENPELMSRLENMSSRGEV
jgi:hypothetical protein